MRLALKVDVDTLRGTREGVPRLVEIFRRHGVGATFLFSVGPDHTGRAIRRVFRPGFVGKVRRTGVVHHYGVKTLLYGTLLPGPDIGRRAGDVMRMTRDEGFETGVHSFDHVRWQDGVATADAAWTRSEMTRMCERYADVFGEAPRVHGAAGWQMNLHALRLTQRLGFEYASDGRGTHPHLPFWNAEPVRCPQFPTTLPTLDELIGLDGVTATNAADRLLHLTEAPVASGHVFTLHAELEGMRLSPVLEQLLGGWKAQGWRLGSLRQMRDAVEPLALPRAYVGTGTVPGRSGTLFVQQGPFPGEAVPRAA
ncbi:MAG: polysaccharide deacetylase family protein [Burkholderiales bacterium]|nr:polysaccharide deacetylase family protein [Burkholderiales bacterium]MCE7875765.1 4-deoxy-4-formamido-L-arabinose-phosphoundecaprenol deformylase [Betaproteobacteria bacterium PRO3]